MMWDGTRAWMEAYLDEAVAVRWASAGDLDGDALGVGQTVAITVNWGQIQLSIDVPASTDPVPVGLTPACKPN